MDFLTEIKMSKKIYNKIGKVTKKLEYIYENILSILELKQNPIALIKNFIHVFNSN